ncbi:ATPase domain-containing protein [Candidatus Aenigmatarchaeota archaeon]
MKIEQGEHVLVDGPSKREKNNFIQKLLLESVKNKENVVYVTTKDFPETIIEKLKHPIEKDKIRFIDCYSSHAGLPKRDTDHILRVNGPRDIKNINKMVSWALLDLKGDVKFIFDSITPILTFNTPRTFKLFFELLQTKLNYKNASAVFVFDNDFLKYDVRGIFRDNIRTITFKQGKNNKFLEGE